MHISHCIVMMTCHFTCYCIKIFLRSPFLASPNIELIKSTSLNSDYSHYNVEYNITLYILLVTIVESTLTMFVYYTELDHLKEKMLLQTCLIL